MKTRLLFFVMMLCALKISADVTSLSGSGTSDDPYLINTVDELGWMRFQVNKGSNSYSTACYKLMTDLDFSWEGDWTPIGKDEDFPFMGIFDGNNKIIKNIKLGRKDHPITGYAYIGFWGCIKNARILNLGIEWEGLHSSISSTRESYSGGIVGYCNGSSIENCYSTGESSSTTYVSISYSGGIVGYGINSNIEKCYSTLDSFYSNYGPTFSGHTGDYNSGGIAGECRNVNIANCFYIGDISSTSSSSTVSNDFSTSGGIVGEMEGGSVVNSYFIGNISYSTTCSNPYIHCGGIVGASNSDVINCYSIGEISTFSEDTSIAGGIVGSSYGSKSIINCYSSANIYSHSSYKQDYWSGSYSGGILGLHIDEEGSTTIKNCIALNGFVVAINEYKDKCHMGRITGNKYNHSNINYGSPNVNVAYGTSINHLISITDVSGDKNGYNLKDQPVDLLNNWVYSNLSPDNAYLSWVVIEGTNNDYPVFGDLPTLAVNFEANEGSAINPGTVKYGELLTKPIDPTREGYEFAGWHKDAELTQPWDFDNDRVYAPMTLYAKWNSFTSIEDMNSDGIIVYSSSRCIIVNNATMPITVYDITGAVVRTVQQPGMIENIDIEPGYYVVKTGQSSTKVVVC